MTFGAKIKRYREEECLTQQELADMLNVSKQEISRYEKNHVIPRKQTAEHFSKVLGLPISYLMYDHIVTEKGLDLLDEATRRLFWRYIDADKYGTPVISYPELVDVKYLREAEIIFENKCQEYKRECEEIKRNPLGRSETKIIIKLREQPELRRKVEQILGIDSKDNKYIE